MKSILTPSLEKNHRHSALGILFLLVLSAATLTLAPTIMPEGYSWIVHTTSESAAQGVEGAWVARLGFLTFGMAVLWLAVASELTWARGVVWMHFSFGVLMVSTAAFSHQPWASGIPFDLTEDKLHSFTATAMGFAFALGVLLRLVQRWRQDSKRQTLDIIALLSATFIPLLMLFQSDIAGFVQRLMFLVAYVWYGSEALELHGSATAQQNAALGGDSATLHPRQ